MDENAGPSKAQRKKERRRQRAASDRSGSQALETLADTAVEEAVAVVHRIETETELALTTEMPTTDAAQYCRKRINEALGYREWLDEVEVWVWNAHTSRRAALTEAGERNGVELRLERRVERL